MPLTPGANLRTVADVVQTLTDCTEMEADQAEAAICQSPEMLAKLAVQCGAGTGQTALGAGPWCTI